MPNLERVIKDLEYVTTDEDMRDMIYPRFAQIMRDALALLKVQEPRVMTLTEVYTADFVYIEFDGVITPALRTSNGREGHRSYFATRQLGGGWMQWDTYGIIWRCWTTRPTDEQRKAVKWDE